MTRKPRLGDMLTVSAWFCGDGQRRKCETLLTAALEADRLKFGLVLGPVEFEVVNADNPRLEGRKPPESGAKCLVAYADVVDYAPLDAEDAGFLANLDPADLERLRRATRSAFKKANPKGFITQDRIDRVIANIGPDTAAKLINE